MISSRTARLDKLGLHLPRMAQLKTSGMSSSTPPFAVSFQELPKSNIFTSQLPPDSKFPTPLSSHQASRQDLGPRMVQGALYTFVRPEPSENPQLLAISHAAMRDIGLREGEEDTADFKSMVSGNKIFWSAECSDEGIYPWAQCYGGWQFGSWAGQLGDGRAISIFESTNPLTKARYEIQLKGAGKTPYSRFADGKAVLRSSIREFVVSEALHGLGVPSTRALALTLLPHERVQREKIEPGAIVARCAPSWLRIGNFDILRARGDRKLVRRLADYVAENVYGGHEAIQIESVAMVRHSRRAEGSNDIKPLENGKEENRYAHLFRAIACRNAKTVAEWQAYGFMNGVLNTDNTSLLGLSLDFGPFAFMDNFDPDYTPNHDDHMLRYSYRNQPSIIWWNLVRLGESLGELIGAGPQVDHAPFIEKGLDALDSAAVIKRAEAIIGMIGEDFRTTFFTEYSRLMRERLGIENISKSDLKQLVSSLLDVLENLGLDFNHFFRRLSKVDLADVDTLEGRKATAGIFFHKEGIVDNANVANEDEARSQMATWLESWHGHVLADTAIESNGTTRQDRMIKVNPKFIPRSWILDEIITRVDVKGDREVLSQIMQMVEAPFAESWKGVSSEDAERWCGDVPRTKRGMQCSCSS